jgi:hypothetical protein
MIDKEGKLFGKINLIDFFVLLMISGIVGGATFVYQKNKYRQKVLKECKVCECEVELLELKEELALAKKEKIFNEEEMTKEALLNLYKQNKLMIY